jgi:hypothetical protein
MHQPTGVGQRHFRLFDYVRALQGLGLKWDARRARVAFKAWWWDARHVARTKCERTSWKEFVDAWRRCERPVTRLDAERLREESAGEALPRAAAGHPASLATLLKACVCLQRWHGGGPFYLSNEDAGRLTGRGAESGRLDLRRLVNQGLLERVSVGSNLTGRASVYRCPWPRPEDGAGTPTAGEGVIKAERLR